MKNNTVCMGRIALAMVVVGVAWWMATPVQADAAGLRRFALIVGANDGGSERAVLRYANSDAKSVGRILTELGGLDTRDRVMLFDPHCEDVMAGLKRLQDRMSEARSSADRIELIVYYSGHSDEQGLLLYGERLGYRELRQAIEALSADVRIVILDSCASGAMTRAKGGKRRPPFLSDRSIKVHGHAILTSSAADEVAQESERIGGSFFTYFLLSGLRGAADLTGDGRVTLTEAYQFTFEETLNRTESTRGGAQHAAFDIQLVGSGDLVLTDLRGTSASMIIEPALEGRLFIRDRNGRLVLELYKSSGRPVELSLDPGPYQVSLDGGLGAMSRAELTLQDGEKAPLTAAMFTAISPE
ncbi:MAG: caspase family protein, partial [Myxococcota bacterium]